MIRPLFKLPMLVALAGATLTPLCLCTNALAQSESGAAALTNQARQHLKQGDRSGARNRLLQAIRLDPGYGPAWIELAASHERDGDLAEALKVYQACIDRAPGYPDGFRARAKLLERLGRMEDASADLRAALLLSPADPALRSECLEFFVRRGAWSAALQHSRAMQAIFEARGEREDAVRARVKTLALGVLAAESDPVRAGAQRRGWERRAIASIGSRLGAL